MPTHVTAYGSCCAASVSLWTTLMWSPGRTGPLTFRLRDGCSASTWTAPTGSGLLMLDALSVQTAPDGYRRIVWMIKCLPTDNRMALSPSSARARRQSTRRELANSTGLEPGSTACLMRWRARWKIMAPARVLATAGGSRYATEQRIEQEAALRPSRRAAQRVAQGGASTIKATMVSGATESAPSPCLASSGLLLHGLLPRSSHSIICPSCTRPACDRSSGDRHGIRTRTSRRPSQARQVAKRPGSGLLVARSSPGFGPGGCRRS